MSLFYIMPCVPLCPFSSNIVGGVREVNGHLFEILVQPRALYKKGTYVPFCQPCTGQELNIVGGLREVQRLLL